jgi:hypothetical protein
MSVLPQLSHHNLLRRAINDTVGPNKIHFILRILSRLGCYNPSEGYNLNRVSQFATLYLCTERSGVPLAGYDYEAIKLVLSRYLILQEVSVIKRRISRQRYNSKRPKQFPVLQDDAEISLPTTSFDVEFDVPSSPTYNFPDEDLAGTLPNFDEEELIPVIMLPDFPLERQLELPARLPHFQPEGLIDHIDSVCTLPTDDHDIQWNTP